jgi:DNA-directed RNA polymerase subunit beta'
MTQIRRIATSRDELILEERRKGTGADLATPMLQDLAQAEGAPVGE